MIFNATMAEKSFDANSIALLERRLLSSPSSLPEIDRLLQFSADGSNATSLRLAAVHSLRRVFTHYYHNGLLSGAGLDVKADKKTNASSMEASGKKRKRPDDTTSDAVAQWLKQRFHALLTVLVEILEHAPKEGASNSKKRKSRAADDEDDGDESDAIITLGITALRTFLHFASNAVSVAQQTKERGQHVSIHIIKAFLQLALCVDEREVDAEVADAYHRALQAFRTDFMDDYDDIRYYTLKAITQLMKEKVEDKDKGIGNSLWEQRFRKCPAETFVRNTVTLLLDVTLPTSETEWNDAEHATHLQQSWGDQFEGIYDFHSAESETTDENPGAKTYALSDDSDDELGLNVKLSNPAPAATRDDGALLPLASSGAAARKKAAKFVAVTPTAPPTDADEHGVTPPVKKIPVYYSLKEQRKAFAEAWIATLQIPSTPDVTRRILTALPTDILPIMPDRFPLLLADFLTASTDSGGANALLALQSLFLLMQHHGLEYPQFYARLYALLTPESVTAKYRARFFTLLDLFLSSPLLPAYLVAAFCKRAARLAVTSTTPTAMFALPFIYNCLKRHPACTPLIHKASGATAGADFFVAEESDPAKCRALESSLWEIIALQQHFYAPVSHLARVFMKELTKQDYDISEYAHGTYKTYITEELERKVKQQGVEQLADIPFAFAMPKNGLFGDVGEAETESASKSSDVASIIDFNS